MDSNGAKYQSNMQPRDFQAPPSCLEHWACSVSAVRQNKQNGASFWGSFRLEVWFWFPCFMADFDCCMISKMDKGRKRSRHHFEREKSPKKERQKRNLVWEDHRSTLDELFFRNSDLIKRFVSPKQACVQPVELCSYSVHVDSIELLIK